MQQKEAEVGELQKRLLGVQEVTVGVSPSGPDSRAGEWGPRDSLRWLQSPFLTSSRKAHFTVSSANTFENIFAFKEQEVFLSAQLSPP